MMEAFDHTDSLEDWVAVKCNVFTDNVMPPRLKFHVSWNDFVHKVAVSCRLNTRTVADTNEQHSRSGLFTWPEVKGAHELLCLVHPSLIQHLPALPDDGWGLWAYITTQQTPTNIDDICTDLEHYFKVALEICKEKLLMSVLFEEHSPDDYFENISELRYRGYVQSVEQAEDELKNVTFIRDSCVTMFDLSDIYTAEDEVVFKFNVLLAELYNYQLQPFLDMRELAKSKLRVAKAELECEHLGDRRKREAADVITEWQVHYEHALDSTQQLYIAYYKHTSNTLQGMKARMQDDQKRFGKNAFDIVGAERLIRIEEDYYLERLQLLQNLKVLYTHERDKVKEEIASVAESGNVQARLSELEHEVYDWQIKIYDMQLKIAGEEEMLYKTQLGAITRRVKDTEARVVFYDAVEDPTSMPSSDDEEDSAVKTQMSARVLRIQQNLAKVNRSRARVRTRKAHLIGQSKNREKQRLDDEHTRLKHHAIQQKRNEQQDDLIKKQDFISEERQKTIERLKNFKMKYPTPTTIRPPRYQPSSKSTRTTPDRHTERQTLAEHKKVIRKSQHKTDICGLSQYNAESGDIPVTIHMSGRPHIPHDTTDSMQCGDTPVSICGNVSVPPPPPCPPPTVPPAPPPPPLPTYTPPPPPVPTPPPPPPVLPLPSNDDNERGTKIRKPPPTTTHTVPTPSPPTSVITKTSLVEATKMLKSVHERELAPKPSNPGGPPKLESILSGRKNLRSANEDRQARRILPPKDPVDDIMSMIRNGVRLRPVNKSTEQRPLLKQLPSDSHLSLLRQRLSQINDITAGNSSDSSEENDFDFDD